MSGLWRHVCATCGEPVPEAKDYSFIEGYAMGAGCRRCNPRLRSDRETIWDLQNRILKLEDRLSDGSRAS